MLQGQQTIECGIQWVCILLQSDFAKLQAHEFSFIGVERDTLLGEM
jgi:hypothetical protein